MRIVLNPNGTQEKSRNFVLEGAWMKYTNNGGHETLKSKGPLHRDVNLLVCFITFSSIHVVLKHLNQGQNGQNDKSVNKCCNTC